MVASTAMETIDIFKFRFMQLLKELYPMIYTTFDHQFPYILLIYEAI